MLVASQASALFVLSRDLMLYYALIYSMNVRERKWGAILFGDE